MILESQKVLDGAPKDASETVVISRYPNGRICVGATHPAEDALAAMRQAREWLEAGCPEQQVD